MIRTLKEKKGFTLIELLAVIAVLAIVSVLATRTVLPYMSKATKSGFALEANHAREAASDAITLINLNKVKLDLIPQAGDAGYTKSVSGNTTTYCFTLKRLNEIGTFDIDEDSVKDASSEYQGTVTVTITGNGTPTYKTEMRNKNFYINKAGKVDADTDVYDLPVPEASPLKEKCK